MRMLTTSILSRETKSTMDVTLAGRHLGELWTDSKSKKTFQGTAIRHSASAKCKTFF